jgi:signal transduction histidine kinase
MASRQRSIPTTFVIALALGAFAVATVAIALTFNTAAAQTITDAERDRAAIVLLEQRAAVSGLLAAEQAATVVDLVEGPESMVATPLTSQRTIALDTALDRVAPLDERADSVGSEAQRWLAAIRSIVEPVNVADDFDRLATYRIAVDTACCTGVVPSDEHHTDELAQLEAAAALPMSVWDHFYLGVARVASRDASVPSAVRLYLEQRGISSASDAETPLPSETLGADVAAFPSLGVSHDAVNSLLSSEALTTLDNIVLNVTGRSSVVVSIDEAYAAADATQRSIDEMVAGAVESARQRLADRIQTADQIRLLTIVLAPLLLAVFAGLGLIAYRFDRSRRAARQREQDLLDNRNRFMRMVSHELRTPATAISGFTEMLSSDWTSLTEAEISEFLAIINRQSSHLSLLVDDLLTLSHLETGRLRLHLSMVNLKQAATDAISLVDARYGIDVETTIDPSITLLADPDRLVQVLRNLIENAAKYGKVGVSVSAAVVGSGCDIVVSDQGSGVPPAMVDRIFRFWDRGDKDGSRIRGYGMGLAIARHLARAMVGDLVYRAGKPVGSEFVLSLPLGPPEVTKVDGPPVSASTQAGIHPAAYRA